MPDKPKCRRGFLSLPAQEVTTPTRVPSLGQQTAETEVDGFILMTGAVITSPTSMVACAPSEHAKRCRS